MCRPVKRPKIESLLEIMSNSFEKFVDPRSGPIKIKLSDFLKTAYSVFYLKEPSLLSFEETYQKDQNLNKNLRRLMGIEDIPSDTHLRDILDLIDYKQYRSVFKNIFAHVQQTKLLEQFSLLNINEQNYYLVAVDGTGYFSSKKNKCDHCMQYHEESDDKKTRFGHQDLKLADHYSKCDEDDQKEVSLKVMNYIRDQKKGEHDAANVVSLFRYKSGS